VQFTGKTITMNTPYHATVSQEAPPLKILLLTDDSSVMRKFRQLLTPSYTVLTANTGADGLELAYNDSPDLVLCDAIVQDSSGYQFLITLRDDPLLKHIPFILFSRPNAPANTRKGMNLGADDYLVSPFSSEELLKSIQSRMNRFHNIRDLYSYSREHTIYPVSSETSTMAIRERLSKTESKILGMIARGMSSRDIASFKCISVRTVDNHRHNITKKLQLSGPNALVKFAMGYAGAIAR
jgi:two-component system, OmpR family, response regulator